MLSTDFYMHMYICIHMLHISVHMYICVHMYTPMQVAYRLTGFEALRILILLSCFVGL